MELNVTNETENPLFNRKEISGNISAESIPSRAEVTKALAEKLKAQEDAIKIKKIGGNFGSKTFTLEANIYTSKEEKDKVEIKKKKDEAAPKEEDASQKEGGAATPEGGQGGAPSEEAGGEPAAEAPAEEAKPAEPEAEPAKEEAKE